MKIAILTPGGVDRSGTERVIPCLLWLIERLVQNGDEIHIFALRQETQPGRWPLLGASVHDAGRSLRRALGQVIAEHQRGHFAVLHAMWASPAGVVAGAAGKFLRVPVLLHLLGGDLVRIPDIGYGGLLTTRGCAAASFAVRTADRVAVLSAASGRQVHGLGIKAERVPLGVALDRWPIIAPRRRTPSAPAKLLHVASLNRVKDQITLLNAIAGLQSSGLTFRLDIIGEDTLDGAVHRHCGALGLAHCVRFHGFLQHHAMRPFFEQADLHIIASRSETGPVTVLEAAVAGVPSVGTRVGHLADWAPRAAGVVEPGDAAALAHVVARVLENEEERLGLATAAQALAIDENADATTKRVREIYAELSVMRRRPA